MHSYIGINKVVFIKNVFVIKNIIILRTSSSRPHPYIEENVQNITSLKAYSFFFSYVRIMLISAM